MRFDPKTNDEEREVQTQIEFVSKYYKWLGFSEFSKQCRLGKGGHALLVFDHPRARLFGMIHKFLLDREIPFLLGVRTDCVGVYELMWEEVLAGDSAAMIQYWVDPHLRASRVSDYRRQISSADRVSQLDPSNLLVGWGEIAYKLRPEDELAMYLYEEIVREVKLRDEIKFIANVTQKLPSVLLTPRFIKKAREYSVPVITGEVREIRGSHSGLFYPYWTLSNPA